MNFTNLGHLVVKLASGVAFGVVLASVAPGCGDADHPRVIGGGDTMIVPGGRCTDGSTSECHLTLSEHNGVLTCLNGTKTCDAGTWSDCDGDLSTMAAPRWYQQGLLRAQALSSPADCDPENPCDPSCQQYDENPDDPLEDDFNPPIPFMSMYDWSQGSLSGFPGGLVRKGVTEPCHTASDCQFDMYCEYPGKGACTHSMCETGAALVNTCDTSNSTTSCVQRICDQDSLCCTAANCEHDLCVTGVALKSACGDSAANQVCSKAVCDAIPSCCNESTGSWSSTCVNAVATYCAGANNIGECRNCTNTGGQVYDSTTDHCYAVKANNSTDKLKWGEHSCSALGTSWNLATITTAAENTTIRSLSTTGKLWVGASSSNSAWTWVDNSSVSDPIWTGGPARPATNNNYYLYLDTSATTTTASRQQSPNNDADWHSWICEGPNVKAFTPLPGAVSNHTWDNTCIGYVKTLCGAVCGTGAAAATTTGYCQPYDAGYVDSTCAAPNLTAPPTCSGNQVTVCNHGTVDVTGTFWIYSFTGNSSYFGDRSAAEMCNPTQNNPNICTVDDDVASGECVTITCAGLVNNGEVWIKPPTGVTECECKDNWTLYKDSVPACSTVGCGTSNGFYPELATGSCTALVPSTLYEDGSLVSLTWNWLKGGNDGTTALTYLTSSAGCSTTPMGWYYTTVSGSNYFALCNSGATSACSQVKDSSYSSSKVYLSVDDSACDTPGYYEQTSFLNTYGDLDSACGVDRGIQWSYLYYDATIPSDSSIEFRLAVAATAAELPTTTDPSDAAWGPPITRSNPDEVCGSGSSCAIDLFSELGGLPDAQVPYLAVLITLVPSSDLLEAPTVNSWDITYSCPFNQ